MARIYANQLIKGNIAWEDVADTLKDAVKAILRSYVKSSRITVEQYNGLVQMQAAN